MESTSNILRQNGRFVSKRKLAKKAHGEVMGKRRKLQSPEKLDVKGNRIMNVMKLAEDLWCSSCNEPLSLRYIEKDISIGLASIFSVRCHTCLLIHEVTTSNFRTEGHQRRYDVNCQASLGKLGKYFAYGSMFYNFIFLFSRTRWRPGRGSAKYCFVSA